MAQPSPMSGEPIKADEIAAAAARNGALRASLGNYFRRRLSQVNDVDDLVQEVFVRLAGRQTGAEISNLDGYIFQTASNVLADYGRRRAVRKSSAHVSLEPADHGTDDLAPDRIAAGKQELRSALARLLELPERTRTIFILHRLEGLRYREVAIQLGLSVSAVEKHMIRAIRHLGTLPSETAHDT
ncbi:sigma-70 family RNA polymerase sigma factor [Sphingomonas sp. BN140010]|uniref:Sigma-70 family RNA polymerase sigma factor n=1 Tax=Sphingomonas arvum TaxID=2992113 RepID=A0ABT3JDT9_9SPHN|nr:sigma-70 family RNA polymerase sigma factor [Sphingomonas sp. BN140010]MCW3797206.1 sigma-70 family RNA polymerase sigma factor [Sphingomonas sp. BN140010]